MSVLILIPARMASARLPDKPLADISGLPMIERVRRQALAAKIGEVVVATDSAEIFDVVTGFGGRAVMTGADHPSGSDRIYEALTLYDPNGSVERIVNVQGDLPDIDPAAIALAARILDNPAVDIATLAALITEQDERDDPNVVKAVGSPINSEIRADLLRALYFTRATAPSGDGPLYHHIGLYAYRRAALERFVSLPPSILERRERLEQLRAVEAGMRIDIGIVDAVPLGVDTPADLEKARRRITG